MAAENIHIIGTSHIAKDSVAAVTRALGGTDAERYDIVAVELDADRAHALLSGERRGPSLGDIRRIGLFGFLFGAVGGALARKLGKIVGVNPGEEMKTAISLSARQGIRVVYIDQHIAITLRRLSAAFTLREFFRIIADMFSSLIRPRAFMRKLTEQDPQAQRDIANLGNAIDQGKVPDDAVIAGLMRHLERRYPSLHRVLIAERNMVMASHLASLARKHPDKKILAVMGAGHVAGVRKLLERDQENDAQDVTYDTTYNFTVG